MRDHILVALLVRDGNTTMRMWESINLSGYRNRKSSGEKKGIYLNDLMISVIEYAESFSDQYKIPFEELRTVDTARNEETTTCLNTKSNSTYERHARVGKILVGVKSVR